MYGGNGDDKIWANLPGTTQADDGENYLYGNTGADILYGSVKSDQLFGDWNGAAGTTTDVDRFDTEGGDDIIYTGVAAAAADGS